MLSVVTLLAAASIASAAHCGFVTKTVPGACAGCTGATSELGLLNIFGGNPVVAGEGQFRFLDIGAGGAFTENNAAPGGVEGAAFATEVVGSFYLPTAGLFNFHVTFTDAVAVYINGAATATFKGQTPGGGVTTAADFTTNLVAGENTIRVLSYDDNAVAPASVLEVSFKPDGVVVAYALLQSGAEISVSGLGLPIADTDLVPRLADGTSFGNSVHIGATAQAEFRVSETAAVFPLTVTKVEMHGPNADQFSAIGTFPTAQVIAPGGALDVAVTFKPTTVGLKTATVTITTNCCLCANADTTYEFKVQGEGVEAQVDLSGLVTAVGNVQTAVNTLTANLGTLSGVVGGINTTVGAIKTAQELGAQMLQYVVDAVYKIAQKI